MHKLLGHSKWIRLLTILVRKKYLLPVGVVVTITHYGHRSIKMVGDTVITGSDDWTARVWSVSQGFCNAVLACHDGPVLCVEYSIADKGIITG